jgi:hypothetical protein
MLLWYNEPDKYTHRDSDIFRFDGEGYIPLGHDLHGTDYYRLTDIAKDEDGVFSARFDGFYLPEAEMSEPKGSSFLTRNGRAIYDAAGDIEYFPDGRTFDETVLKLFSRPDYLDVLELNVRVSVKFRLSDSENHAFFYLACSKEYMKK